MRVVDWELLDDLVPVPEPVATAEAVGVCERVRLLVEDGVAVGLGVADAVTLRDTLGACEDVDV